MKNIISGLMAVTVVLAFSMEASAKKGLKDPNTKSSSTSADLVKDLTNKANSQGRNSTDLVLNRAQAIKTADSLATNATSTGGSILTSNLSSILSLNKTALEQYKVDSHTVIEIAKSLGKVDANEVILTPNKALKKLEKDLGKFLTPEQIKELKKEKCRMS